VIAAVSPSNAGCSLVDGQRDSGRCRVVVRRVRRSKYHRQVCDPAVSTVPDAGAYAKLPAVVEEASSCVAFNAVPYVIDAGVAQ